MNGKRPGFRLEWIGWGLTAIVLVVTAAIWVFFGLAELHYDHVRRVWTYEPGPVIGFGMAVGLLVLAAAIVMAATYRPGWVHRWRTMSTPAVLALLAFVAVLLALKALEPYAWLIPRQQVRGLRFAAAAVDGLVVLGLVTGFLFRRSRDAVRRIWLVTGTFVALTGLMVWMNWNHGIP